MPARPGVPALLPLSLPPGRDKTPHLGSNPVYRCSHLSSLPAPREGEAAARTKWRFLAGGNRELCGIRGCLRSPPDRDWIFNRKEKRDKIDNREKEKKKKKSSCSSEAPRSPSEEFLGLVCGCLLSGLRQRIWTQSDPALMRFVALIHLCSAVSGSFELCCADEAGRELRRGQVGRTRSAGLLFPAFPWFLPVGHRPALWAGKGSAGLWGLLGSALCPQLFGWGLLWVGQNTRALWGQSLEVSGVALSL